MCKDGLLVSIVTPSFNQAPFLERAILSVLQQDYDPIEYLIIDGVSTDGSLDIIRTYERRLAYWISEKDGGSAEAINKGWRRSQGRYLWILNSDDRLATPGAISGLVRHLQAHPQAAFAYGDMYYIDAADRIIGARRFPEYDLPALVLEKRQYPFPGCLMRREVLDTVGYFDTRFRTADDLDFYLRLARQHSLSHLAEFTGYFRIHPRSNTQALLPLHGQEILDVYDKFLRSPDLPQPLRSRTNRIRAVAHYRAADCFLRSGQARAARSQLWQAFSSNPGYVWDAGFWYRLGLTVLGDRGMIRAMMALLRILPSRYK